MDGSHALLLWEWMSREFGIASCTPTTRSMAAPYANRLTVECGDKVQRAGNLALAFPPERSETQPHGRHDCACSCTIKLSCIRIGAF